ncbi:MAG: hypothetical protein FWD89_01555 [Firmicutes bacterium]|nr:hypothetical protein [Bacillota bacterium]MCL2770977.1 hypothetical protein [Bacillota bacterium]
MSRDITFRKILNFLAFCAIMIIAASILLSNDVLSISFLGWMRYMAEIVAYGIVAIAAFFFARSKRNVAYMIAYIIAMVVLVIFYIIGF